MISFRRLISSAVLTSLFLTVALLSSGCHRRSASKTPAITPDDCEMVCKRISECGEAVVNVLMPGKSFANEKVRKRAMKAFTNAQSCTLACTKQLKDPKKSETYAAFISAQKGCVDRQSCVDFAKCLWTSTRNVVMTYPIDEAARFRCHETCRMQKKCSRQLLTLMAGPEYTKASPDRQAEMEKKFEDTSMCEFSCRRHFIKEGKLDEFSRKASACLNQHNCDEYSKCIMQQILSEQ